MLTTALCCTGLLLTIGKFFVCIYELFQLTLTYLKYCSEFDLSLKQQVLLRVLLFSLSITRMLIDRGCNVNAVGGVLASTPLHWAARHGHTHMVALLVAHGADLHLCDVEGIFK